MIGEKAASRAQQWVQDAAREGATILTGGQAGGPTGIENSNSQGLVCPREAFAPVVTIFPVRSSSKGIDRLNDSDYGLRVGIFSNRLEQALTGFERVQAGGVIIDDVAMYRIDRMLYGGVKHFGLGRAGVKYAIEDMTEQRLMVLNRL